MNFSENFFIIIYLLKTQLSLVLSTREAWKKSNYNLKKYQNCFIEKCQKNVKALLLLKEST